MSTDASRLAPITAPKRWTKDGWVDISLKELLGSIDPETLGTESERFLGKLAQEAYLWQEEHYPRMTALHAAAKVAEEGAEVLAEVNKAAYNDEPVHRGDLMREVGDAFFTLLAFCGRMQFHPHDMIEFAFEANGTPSYSNHEPPDAEPEPEEEDDE